ncbi:MAG: hypothetical protein AAFW65_09495 [Pseudomonadota bacterium]
MDHLLSAIRHPDVSVGQSAFLAIDGLGASGKSTLATLLSGKLGAEIIRLDDFSGPEPFSWMPRLRAEILEPVSRGATSLTYQPESWWGQTPPPVTDQPVTPVMIVEGVGSHHPELRAFWRVTIFVDTPATLCLERGVARDLATGEPESAIRRQWEAWQAEELTYLAEHDPAAHVDFIVKGDVPFDTQV